MSSPVILEPHHFWYGRVMGKHGVKGEDGKVRIDDALYWRLHWERIADMIENRRVYEYWAFYDVYYRLAERAGHKPATVKNIAAEMAYRDAGWMPDDEWQVHRMRPPLTAAHLRGFADGLEPKRAVAPGRPSKYPWGALDSEAEGWGFTLSPGEGQPRLATVRVLASRRAKSTGYAISCRQLDDGAIDVRRRV